jgi:hypothetical protein
MVKSDELEEISSSNSFLPVNVITSKYSEQLDNNMWPKKNLGWA